MDISIRPARQEDQETIVSFVRQAKLNPRRLHWQNFLIAEDDSKIVGIRQVKTYKQGTREVASGFVLPYYEKSGFRREPVDQLPSDFHSEYRIGRIVTTLMSLFSKERVRIIPMKRD